MPDAEKTDILIIGSGSREHALAWKLSQSSRVGTIYVAPGNGGTESFCKNVEIKADNVTELLKFALSAHVGLTVVGPEDAIASGIVDQFKHAGLRIFGPTKAAAKIETSKAFAKKLMEEAGIPTAVYRSFTEVAEAHVYAEASTLPLVVKASGLADGKGVCICETKEAAHSAIDDLMVKKTLGEAGTTVVIEEFITGDEISVHAFTDGVNYALCPSSQDHKRVGEGDTGKNTGGMGTIAAVPWVTSQMMLDVENMVIKPMIRVLGEKGTPFQGMLFPAIMLTPTGPKVIEWNVCFGDPETQVYMRLLESDLLDLLNECVDGGIGTHVPLWGTEGAINIVLTSKGYPDDYTVGYTIGGLIEAGKVDNVVVFHGGTKRTDALRTNGGRVLSVSAIGSPIERARDLAYQAVEKIAFEGKYFRRDIGSKSILPSPLRK